MHLSPRERCVGGSQTHKANPGIQTVFSWLTVVQLRCSRKMTIAIVYSEQNIMFESC